MLYSRSLLTYLLRVNPGENLLQSPSAVNVPDFGRGIHADLY